MITPGEIRDALRARGYRLIAVTYEPQESIANLFFDIVGDEDAVRTSPFTVRARYRTPQFEEGTIGDVEPIAGQPGRTILEGIAGLQDWSKT